MVNHTSCEHLARYESILQDSSMNINQFFLNCGNEDTENNSNDALADNSFKVFPSPVQKQTDFFSMFWFCTLLLFTSGLKNGSGGLGDLSKGDLRKALGTKPSFQVSLPNRSKQNKI